MTRLTSMLVLCMAAAGQQALAATVTFQAVNGVGSLCIGRGTTPAEVANDPSLAGKFVHDFRVTTSSDILRVGDVVLANDVGLYNNPTGTDTEPPLDAFVAVFPALGADSWITTPGTTALAGAGGLNADGNSWFDTTNDGAQTNFLFVRLTLSNFSWTLSGVVSVLNEVGDPEVHPFSFATPDPEPRSLGLAVWGIAAWAGVRRRVDAPRRGSRSGRQPRVATQPAPPTARSQLLNRPPDYQFPPQRS